MNSQPRQHHYDFAHRVLPGLGFALPGQMLLVLTGSKAGNYLSSLWKDVGNRLEQADRCEYPELTFETTRCGSFVITLIGFPVPERITEPHFAAFAFGPLQAITPESLNTVAARYFILEKGFGLDPSESRTVFCEWTKEGSHLNGGDGPQPRDEAFLGSICQKMGIPLNAPRTKFGS